MLITIKPKRFQNSIVNETVETVLSDFHKLYVTVMKMYYDKEKHHSLS